MTTARGGDGMRGNLVSFAEWCNRPSPLRESVIRQMKKEIKFMDSIIIRNHMQHCIDQYEKEYGVVNDDEVQCTEDGDR